MPPGLKLWQLLPHDQAAIQNLARALRISPIIAQLLLNRQVADPAQAQRFLAAPLTGLHEPELFPGMDQATDKILAAVAAGKKICIYGDYDVDGVTGTAILLNLLTLLQAQVEFHIPDRLEEGYGVSRDALATLARRGVNLVITVDCGVTSCAEAELARELGLELIITDHHEPKADLPRADVLLHPRLAIGYNGSAQSYPFGGLSGAGVAFKLAWALCKKASGSPKVPGHLKEFLLDAVALAALGTVADVVPLFDENRIFVRYGLKRLHQQPSLGLQALLRCAKLDIKSCLAAADIGFGLAPRLNAAGRLGTARLAVELLTTASTQRAGILADYLERQNQERQTLERRIMLEARQLAEQDASASAFVLAHPSWHPGLLGIVASRLVEQFARPVLMIALREGQTHGQGSGRSVPGFRLHEALQECTERLASHGGHASAAGFRILPDAIAQFREQFCAIARRHFGEQAPAHRLTIDAEVPLSALTTGLMEALEQMEPFGSGNPAPLFLAGDCEVVGDPKRVGNGERHLSFRVRQGGKYLKAIAFGLGDRLEELLSQDRRCAIVFTPRFNEFQGFRSIDLEVRDFQPGGTARLA